ncbi:MAG: zinc-dependent alcohol dehydrogenase family protein [Ferrimonas sp.]
MKAMALQQFGGTEHFQLTDLPTPELQAGQVLIQVAATSVNPVDTLIREVGEGLPFAPALPAILGMDVAGTVVAVGDGVTQFAIGDEVFGCAGGLGPLAGALAEFMLADAQLIAHKPSNLSMREAAALPLVGITAYEGLMRAGIGAGQKVLVHGGAGGVGHVALQLARHFGAEVYATASTPEGLAVIQQLGATAIDYKHSPVADYVARYTAGQGFDLIYDSVGGENLVHSMAAAKLNGQIATTVSLLELDLSTLHFKGLSLHVVFMLIPMIHNQGRQAHAEILAALAALAERGDLQPILDNNQYGLTDVAAAHTRLSSGDAIGKVVIDVA